MQTPVSDSAHVTPSISSSSTSPATHTYRSIAAIEAVATQAISGGMLAEQDLRRPEWLDERVPLQPAHALQDIQYVAKRGIDMFGGLLLTVLLSPLMLVIALAIALTSRGPVLYRSVRLGLAGEPFTCLKFRTMYRDAEARQPELEHRNEAEGPIFKITDDPRVTPVGRFLRATALDELPQLFNVLAGQMSLVGPRPLPLRDCLALSAAEHRRHSVYPGMTGLWQVEPGRHDEGGPTIIELDLRYIDSWSLWGDLRILLRTALVVVGRRADPGPATGE